MPISLDEATEIRSRLLGRAYPKQLVEEHENWWFFPNDRFCIGPAGMVIDKADGHFHALGAGLGRQEWFWAHDHGFKHHVSDLKITKVFNKRDTLQFLRQTGLGCFPYFGRAPSKLRISAEGRCIGKMLITKEHLNRPLVIRNVVEWLLIRDFFRLGVNPPFAYEMRVRSCPNPGCAPDDSRFTLPRRRKARMIVSLEQYLRSGRFGEIKLGMTRKQIGQLLGEPDLDTGSNRRLSKYWNYDDFSIRFSGNRSDCIGFFAPNQCRLPRFLKFSDFTPTNMTSLREFKQFAERYLIPSSLSQDELQFLSGVTIRRHQDWKCWSMTLASPKT